MIEKYFRTGIRNLLKQKFYTLLNVAGFGLGLAMFFFVSLYLFDQFSYDRWYNHKNIYRVEMGSWGILGPAYGRIIKNASSDIESTLRMNTFWGQNCLIHTSDKKSFRVPHLVVADTTVFDFFDFHFVHGNADNAFRDKKSIVLTQSQAVRFFGHDDVLGETIRLQQILNLTITGIIKDVKHFHIHVNALIPFDLFADIYSPEYLEGLDGWNHLTYILLHPSANIPSVRDAIQYEIKEHVNRVFGADFDKELYLRPVADIYFTNNIDYESLVMHGNKMTSYAFLAIAAFILIIAIINFVNLATARSGGRTKEVGIRKLLGSSRRALIFQFLVESMLITFFSIILAFILIELLSPVFITMVGDISVSFHDLGIWGISAIIILGSLVIGFLSGIYPSFYLSGFQPVASLKGENVKGKGALLFRKGLIIFQFTVSVALIAGTLIVYQQLNFLQEKEIGIQKEDIIYFKSNAKIKDKWDSFRTDLLSSPSIRKVGLSNAVPGSVSWQESITMDGETRQYTFWPMTPEYFSLLEITPIAGRTFSREFATDEYRAVLVNQQWLKFMGLGDNYQQLLDYIINDRYRIVGIVPDFHFNSLHQLIGPLMMVWIESPSHMISVSMNKENIKHTLEYINQTWNIYSPEERLEYHFMAETLKGLYSDEKRMGWLFTSFSGFAILIACIGLFGLTSYTVEMRTREISIRKILGASTTRIFKMLLTDFLWLTLIAVVVAYPLVKTGMGHWLNQFPYHINSNEFPIIIAGIAAIMLTIITVGYHVLKISASNPSQALNKQ
jgi:putative ABC transport system permease protein